MENIIHRSALGLLAAVACVGFAASAGAQECTPKHAIKTVEEGYLTVSAPTFPPFSIPKGENEISGIDGEIVTAIAKMECLKIKVAKVEYATAVPYVASGRTDVAIGDYYRTAARAEVVALSDPLYLDEMGIYSKDGISKIDDLKGHSVGTVQGYLWVSDAQKLLGSKLRLYPNSVNLHQDLVAGRIDVGIDGYSAGAYAVKKGQMKGIKVEVAQPDPRIRATKEAAQAAFPYAKSATAFGAALDADIQAMHKDGTIAKIMKSYGLSASAADTGAPRLVQ